MPGNFGKSYRSLQGSLLAAASEEQVGMVKRKSEDEA